MVIEPVAYFRSPISGKFGVPRQAGLVPDLRGTVVLTDPYARPEALRGLEGFDYLWLIWEFSLNGGTSAVGASPGDGSDGDPSPLHLTVRPPRLGGNTRVGVFASRSPFRPNRLGMSSVRILNVDFDRCEIEVAGADLADLTPIYDIKPYVEYADSHPGVRSGFVDSSQWPLLEVVIPPEIASAIPSEDLRPLKDLLSLDPRPAYRREKPGSPNVYAMTYRGHDIRFCVAGGTLTVISAEQKTAFPL